MPKWDFRCDTCDKTIELVFLTFRDSEKAKCPECGGTVARQPSAPNFSVSGYNSRNGYSRKS